MKRIICILLCVVSVLSACRLPTFAESVPTSAGGGDSAVYDPLGEDLLTGAEALKLDAVSAILMEEKTGTVLYEYNADAALPPASVTKIMTLLLVMEAIE